MTTPQLMGVALLALTIFLPMDFETHKVIDDNQTVLVAMKTCSCSKDKDRSIRLLGVTRLFAYSEKVRLFAYSLGYSVYSLPQSNEVRRVVPADIRRRDGEDVRWDTRDGGVLGFSLISHLHVTYAFLLYSGQMQLN